MLEVCHELERMPWMGTVLSALAGLICTLVSFVFFQTGAVVLVLALNLSLITWFLETLRRDVVLVQTNLARQDGISRLAMRIDQPYLKDLAHVLVNRTIHTLELMAHPTQVYQSESDYLPRLGARPADPQPRRPGGRRLHRQAVERQTAAPLCRSQLQGGRAQRQHPTHPLRTRPRRRRASGRTGRPRHQHLPGARPVLPRPAA